MTMNINIRKFITLLSLVITQRDVIAAHFRNLETRISINTTKVRLIIGPRLPNALINLIM